MEAGISPDLVVGVSAGAINSAFFAFDPSLTMVRAMATLWSQLRTRDVLGISWSTVLGLVGLRNYLVEPHRLRALLSRELPYREISATRVPLSIVAADQYTGEDVLFAEGKVIDAILASAAIPGVFPPVTINQQILVDGAVAVGSPIEAACRLGATRLIVLPCGFTCVQQAIPTHPIGRAMHAITLIGARQLRQDFAHHSKTAQIYVVPPLCPMSCSAYDYSHGAELIATARDATRQWLHTGGFGAYRFSRTIGGAYPLGITVPVLR